MGALDNGDELFRLAIEASPAAMILSDSAGRIRFANAETMRMFGYDSAELIGRPIDSLVPAALRRDHKRLRQEFFADPSKRAMGVGRDLRAVRRDGSEFPVEIGLTPIATGEEIVVLATVLDITARRLAEATLALRAAELERANERLAQFAFVASHDLQEPLRKIAAFADFLDQAITGESREEVLRARDVIRTSAIRARALVGDLLIYSRTVNDTLALRRLDLKDQIDIALEELSQLISETGSIIHNEATHVPFEADPSQFARLLQNIVSNAIKYRKPGQVAEIRILGEPIEGDAIRLSIIDNGIGFDVKYATSIFEPFKRLHSKTKYPGTGIGLAICKSIVDRHAWRLSLDSTPGKGASFFITMPRLHEREAAVPKPSS